MSYPDLLTAITNVRKIINSDELESTRLGHVEGLRSLVYQLSGNTMPSLSSVKSTPYNSDAYNEMMSTPSLYGSGSEATVRRPRTGRAPRTLRQRRAQ